MPMSLTTDDAGVVVVVAAAVNAVVAFVAADAIGVVGLVVSAVGVGRVVDGVVAAVALHSASAVSDAPNVDVDALAHQVHPAIILTKY